MVLDLSISKGVVYLVILGFVFLYFEVDEEIGVMKIVFFLDRERYGVYDMFIEVWNKEKFLCYLYFYVIIEIINKDDVYFDFIKVVYDVFVFEGSFKEMFVIVIYVIDKDDLVIIYLILSFFFLFEIEFCIGVIRIKCVFDWVMGDNEFMVYVVVNDGGGKLLEIIVRINVISVYNLVFKF